MTIADRPRLIQRLRALMARTVANGCTEEEELAAARLVARSMAQLDAAHSPQPQAAETLRAERESPDYKILLEKNAVEGLLKSAIQEMALNHINTMSSPSREIQGTPVEWISIPEILNAHLGMMLGANHSHLSQSIIADTITELIQDGQLPARLGIPRAE